MCKLSLDILERLSFTQPSWLLYGNYCLGANLARNKDLGNWAHVYSIVKRGHSDTDSGMEVIFFSESHGSLIKEHSRVIY